MRLWKRRKPLVMAPKPEGDLFTVVRRKPGLVLIESISPTGERNRTWIPSQVKVDDVSA